MKIQITHLGGNQNGRKKTINTFREYLVLEEKSTATVEKYLRDVRAFHLFAGQQAVTKEQMMAYKKFLIEKGYAASSINSMLASLKATPHNGARRFGERF